VVPNKATVRMSDVCPDSELLAKIPAPSMKAHIPIFLMFDSGHRAGLITASILTGGNRKWPSA
jgi:hypothetical protein